MQVGAGAGAGIVVKSAAQVPVGSVFLATLGDRPGLPGSTRWTPDLHATGEPMMDVCGLQVPAARTASTPAFSLLVPLIVIEGAVTLLAFDFTVPRTFSSPGLSPPMQMPGSPVHCT